MQVLRITKKSNKSLVKNIDDLIETAQIEARRAPGVWKIMWQAARRIEQLDKQVELQRTRKTEDLLRVRGGDE